MWHSTTVTASTDGNGHYSFTTNSATKLVWWKIRFAGDSVYYAKNAYNEVLVGQTVTTILSTNYHPPSTITYTLWGYVTDRTGTGLSNAPVNIYYRVWNGVMYSGWMKLASLYTNAYGKYEKTDWDSRLVQYQAVYQGYGAGAPITAAYWYSQSMIISVDSR